jgi:hypothetical protein
MNLELTYLSDPASLKLIYFREQIRFLDANKEESPMGNQNRKHRRYMY